MEKGRTMKKLQSIIAMSVMLSACGGSKGADEPTEVEFVEQDSSSQGDELIPEEKFEEIKNTFERKASTVARCFPEAVETGEVDKNDRIKLTVGVVIKPDGSPSDMKILGTSKRSAALEGCVLKVISRWEFTTLPKPLEYSYAFVLQRF
jgi:hypothetical protein